MNIDEKIIKATKFEDSNMLTEAMDEINLKISEAINPVSRISAPFAVFCLREYADAIECQFPETKSLAKSLEKFFKQTTISIPTKRREVMLAIIKQPGEPAKRIEIDNTLEALQKAVGGYIETVSIFTDITLICNEEGRLMGLPYNMDFAGIRFVGPVLVVGRSEDDFRSLTDEEFTAIMRWVFEQAGESK